MSHVAVFQPTPHSVPAQTGQAGSTLGKGSEGLTAQTAREFEATLIGLVLKEMRQSLEPDGGLFPGDSSDIQGGLFDLYMGKYLAEAGGIGIATAFERQLRSTYVPAPESGRPPTSRTLAG
jgi:peptidoglycan hydrolase FlgJ